MKEVTWKEQAAALERYLRLTGGKIANNSLGYQPEGDELQELLDEYDSTLKKLVELERKIDIYKKLN